MWYNKETAKEVDLFMLLRQIQYFCSVVKNNSFTEAAEECYISQSAISQQIQALEADLGVKLLVRESRKFLLTPAGEHFYHQGLLLLDEADRLRRETIMIADKKVNKLRIGYLKSFGAGQMQKALAVFSEVFTDIDLEITTGTHEELYLGLRDNLLDVVLNDHRRAFSDLYENFYICTGHAYIEVSCQCALSALSSVTLEDLRRIPCILISSKSQQENEQDYYQNTLGFSGRFLFADTLDEGRVMVAANRGFMPVESVQKLTDNVDTIKRIPLVEQGKQITRDYCAFWKKEKDNQYIRSFADMLKEVYE